MIIKILFYVSVIFFLIVKDKKTCGEYFIKMYHISYEKTFFYEFLTEYNLQIFGILKKFINI